MTTTKTATASSSQSPTTTAPPKCFSSFDRSTCALSVSGQYLDKPHRRPQVQRPRRLGRILTHQRHGQDGVACGRDAQYRLTTCPTTRYRGHEPGSQQHRHQSPHSPGSNQHRRKQLHVQQRKLQRPRPQDPAKFLERREKDLPGQLANIVDRKFSTGSCATWTCFTTARPT